MVLLLINREKQKKERPSLDKGIYWGSHEFLKIVEQDERSLLINELDVSKIQLKTMIVPVKGKIFIPGEEKLKRLKEAGYIRLDIGIFLAFWENRKNRKNRFFRKIVSWQNVIPEKWKEIKAIFFDGTIFKTEDNKRIVFCLYWNSDIKKWRWWRYEIAGHWYGHTYHPSAVIANNDL
jgi:hypothetical protein